MLILLLFIGNLLTCVAHSGLTCFNTVGGTCQIGIRPNSFQNISPRCCGGGLATDEVNCPAPGTLSQGTIAAGSKFTVEWPARNHAVGNQNPDGGMTKGISIYLAPKTATTLGDYCGSTTPNQNCPNKICEASYGPSTCQGGTNGDNIPCTTECTMPAGKAPGDYNIMWLWDWRQNDGSMYSSCGDITVSGATAAGPVPTVSPPSPSPTTLAPTDPGQTRAPTRGQAPDSCNPLQEPELVDNQIQFFNVPKEIPYRACSIFLQEVYYKKSSNTLGVLVIDMVDSKGQWHGKGVEIIPGASKGRTTIVMHVWEGKPMIAANGTLTMKAYFVEKSSYDEKVDDGSYSQDQLAIDTSVESPPICAGCNYFRYCGDATMPVQPSCMSQAQLNACPAQPSLPTTCPVDGNMKPVAVNLADDSGAIHNFGTIGIFFSALFVLYM